MTNRETSSAYLIAADFFIALEERPDEVALALELADWLEADEAHRAAWAAVERSADVVKGMAAPRGFIPEARKARARAAIGGGRPLRRRSVLALVVGAAAALVVVIGAGVGLGSRADYATGRGEMRLVHLADGSQVRLGPRSAMNVRFDGGARAVELKSGEAYFEVARDLHRPFSVEAGEADVTVLGTGFDVRRRGDVTEVGVRHGRVRVRSETRTAALGAGDRAVAEGGRLRLGAASPENVGAWSSRRVVAMDRRVDDVLNDVRARTPVLVLLLDPALGAARVTGSYDAGEPVSALEAVVAPHGGRVRRATPWVVLIDREKSEKTG